MLKSLETAKDRRIESVNAIKQQKIDVIFDVVVQRIQTVEDTAEANNNEIFDSEINQIIERQQHDPEILIYSDECDKEHKAAWEAYMKYAKVVIANTTCRTDVQIVTVKRRVKAVQTATATATATANNSTTTGNSPKDTKCTANRNNIPWIIYDMQNQM